MNVNHYYVDILIIEFVDVECKSLETMKNILSVSIFHNQHGLLKKFYFIHSVDFDKQPSVERDQPNWKPAKDKTQDEKYAAEVKAARRKMRVKLQRGDQSVSFDKQVSPYNRCTTTIWFKFPTLLVTQPQCPCVPYNPRCAPLSVLRLSLFIGTGNRSRTGEESRG